MKLSLATLGVKLVRLTPPLELTATSGFGIFYQHNNLWRQPFELQDTLAAALQLMGRQNLMAKLYDGWPTTKAASLLACQVVPFCGQLLSDRISYTVLRQWRIRSTRRYWPWRDQTRLALNPITVETRLLDALPLFDR